MFLVSLTMIVFQEEIALKPYLWNLKVGTDYISINKTWNDLKWVIWGYWKLNCCEGEILLERGCKVTLSSLRNYRSMTKVWNTLITFRPADSIPCRPCLLWEFHSLLRRGLSVWLSPMRLLFFRLFMEDTLREPPSRREGRNCCSYGKDGAWASHSKKPWPPRCRLLTYFFMF